MNEFWKVFFSFGIITIPFTLYVVYSIIVEILEFVLNKRKVEKLMVQADNISFSELEKDLSTYSDKLKSLDEWTVKELEIINKNRELDEREKKTWRKREKDAIYWEKEDLKKVSATIVEKYWVSRWQYQKTPKEIKQELKFRKIFTPE